MLLNNLCDHIIGDFPLAVAVEHGHLGLGISLIESGATTFTHSWSAFDVLMVFSQEIHFMMTIKRIELKIMLA